MENEKKQMNNKDVKNQKQKTVLVLKGVNIPEEIRFSLHIQQYSIYHSKSVIYKELRPSVRNWLNDGKLS